MTPTFVFIDDLIEIGYVLDQLVAYVQRRAESRTDYIRCQTQTVVRELRSTDCHVEFVITKNGIQYDPMSEDDLDLL